MQNEHTKPETGADVGGRLERLVSLRLTEKEAMESCDSLAYFMIGQKCECESPEQDLDGGFVYGGYRCDFCERIRANEERYKDEDWVRRVAERWARMFYRRRVAG